MLAGTPKVGKSTLAAAWAPDTTLIVDTHNGTKLSLFEPIIHQTKTMPWEL
jgi:predicted GTPase